MAGKSLGGKDLGYGCQGIYGGSNEIGEVKWLYWIRVACL